MNLDWRTAF